MDFFELVWAESQSLDSRERKKDILYTGTKNWPCTSAAADGLPRRGKAARLVQDRQPMHYTWGQVGKELLHRSLNECFSRVTQLQDESLPCSTQRGVKSAVPHVSAEYYLRITAHGKLRVSSMFAFYVWWCKCGANITKNPAGNISNGVLKWLQQDSNL